MNGLRAAALLAALVVLPCAAAAPTGDFANGQSTAFGSIAMPAYLSGSAPAAVVARIHLANPGMLPADGHLLFGFSTLDAQAHVRLDALTLADGTPLAREAGSSPGTAEEPRFVVAAAALGGATDLLLHGTAWADGNGRFHLGALAIAFDAGWSPVVGPDGPAQLYAFTALGASAMSRGAFDAPFSGQGNLATVLIPCALLVAFVGLLWWISRGSPRGTGDSIAAGNFLRLAAPRRLVVAAPQATATIPKRPVRAAPAVNWPPPKASRPARPALHPVRNLATTGSAAPAPRGRPQQPVRAQPGRPGPAPRPRSDTPARPGGLRPGP